MKKHEQNYGPTIALITVFILSIMLTHVKNGWSVMLGMIAGAGILTGYQQIQTTVENYTEPTFAAANKSGEVTYYDIPDHGYQENKSLYNGGKLKETVSYNERLAGSRELPPVVIPPRIMDTKHWEVSGFSTRADMVNNEIATELHNSGYETHPIPTKCTKNNSSVENYDYSGMNSLIGVDTQMGVYADNVEHGLPINLGTGPAMRSNGLNQFNKNLFSTAFQPKTYYRNEVIEPVISNIGITQAIQRPNMKRTFDMDGNEIILGTARKVEKPKCRQQPDSLRSVYDPRQYGYGTSYRHYLDPMTGQPRFYYSDVNAARQSNYITRNDVDWGNMGPTIGSGYTSGMGKSFNEIRPLVNNRFVENQILHRTDMQNSLMRKQNAVQWQNRMFPKHTYV